MKKKTSKRKKMSRFKKLVISFMAIVLLGITGCFAINIYVIKQSKPYIYTDQEDVPLMYTVIVPGAAVTGNRSVSFVLRDRLEGAMSLIESEKCVKFLVSGDHGTKEYDEVNASRKYIYSKYDFPKEFFFMDHAGFSTYETMYRARDVFCVEDCCIVTQSFHIYRSVFIARKLGLNAVGLIAPEMNHFSTSSRIKWQIREFFARVKAFLQVLIKAKPTYLGEKIPVTGDSLKTWD